MDYKKKEHFKCRLQRMMIPWMALLLFGIMQNVYAQSGSNNSSILDTGVETETDASGGTRANEQVDGESYFISGMYIAGKGSIQTGNMTSKGFKLRTGQDNGRVVFTVNFPYTITDIALEGIANYDAKGDGACISVTKVEVDGVEVSFNGGQFPPKGANYSESLILKGIQAKETIAIYFDNSNADGTQINMSYIINWERPNASKPVIKVSPQTLGLIVGESYKTSVKIAPKTFPTHWYSDNEKVATVDEEGNVYARSSGKANIIHAWTDDIHVGDTTFLQVTNLGVLTPYIIKNYDFTSMGDVTLTINDEQKGYFYMPGYYSYTPVYACTNAGLEDLAIQQPLVDERSGWAIVGGSGLYMGSGSDKSAAICNLKAGQIVDIVYTGSEIFIGTFEGEYRKKNINESTGRAIFQMEEDGMLGFGLTRGNYVKSITIYEKKTLTLDNLSYSLPDNDILYDGEKHGAIVNVDSEMGALHIYYENSEGVITEEAPSLPGTYTVSFEFEECDLYYATEFVNVGTFTIYNLDALDWQLLMNAYSILGNGETWNHKWDFSSGIIGAKNLYGVKYAKGHVAEIHLNNNNMSGTFPYILLTFPLIEKIDVSHNLLTGDLDLTAYDFVQQNPAMMANVKEINMSGNRFSGNIGIFANRLVALTSLDASDNCLEEVYPVIPSTVTTLNLSNQTIARVVPLHLANLSVDSIAKNVPSILLYDHANQTFTPNINLLCTTPDNTWGMTMSYQNGTLSIPYVSEQNTYYGESGDTLNVVVLNGNGSREGSTFRIKLSFDEGDGNFDGQVNILDLQTTINYMFEEYTNKPYNFTAANLWKDEVINVQDAVSLVNILLEGNSVSAPAKANNHLHSVASITSDDDVSVFVADGKLVINAAVPVSSFDIVVSTGSEISMNESLASAGFTCTVKHAGNKIHLVGYSLSGATLPAGKNVLGTLNEGIVMYSMLADSEANEVTTAFGAATTGIHSATLNTTQRFNEAYKISLGAKRFVVIDANGKKYMVTEK